MHVVFATSAHRDVRAYLFESPEGKLLAKQSTTFRKEPAWSRMSDFKNRWPAEWQVLFKALSPPGIVLAKGIIGLPAIERVTLAAKKIELERFAHSRMPWDTLAPQIEQAIRTAFPGASLGFDQVHWKRIASA